MNMITYFIRKQKIYFIVFRIMYIWCQLSIMHFDNACILHRYNEYNKYGIYIQICKNKFFPFLL